MANALNINLYGKVVILKEKYYAGTENQRMFKCVAGYGTLIDTKGTAIFGYFIDTREECRVEGYEVEKLA